MPHLQIGQVGPRRRYKRGAKKGKAYRLKLVGEAKKRPLTIVKNPKGPLTIPLKCGYQYSVIGTSAASLNFDQTVGFDKMPAAWLTRYEAMFDYVRINKVRVEITCPYNIGQGAIGVPLFRLWYKRALTTAETVPDTETEWLNDQRMQRKTFSGRTNSVNLYWTPGYETTVQPLNTAATSLRVLYKQWQSIQTTPAAMTPHIGALATVTRLDGGPIDSAKVFRVNVTMYCELKGVKEL